MAVLVHFGLTSRWSEQTAARQAENRRLRDEQKGLMRQQGPLERRAELRARARALVGRSASARASDEAAHEVRAGIVAALGRTGRYRLDVHRGNAGSLATVALSTEGGFFEMTDLVTTLAPPKSGLVLQQIQLAPTSTRVGLQIDAVALGGGS
jgi:hypothetical protein